MSRGPAGRIRGRRVRPHAGPRSLTSNSFFKQEGPDSNDRDKPDFSKPMQFGFTMANSSPTAGVCIENRQALIDNFFVDVH